MALKMSMLSIKRISDAREFQRFRCSDVKCSVTKGDPAPEERKLYTSCDTCDMPLGLSG